MKIITCASYHGKGSSALTDLVTEYNGVKSLGEYEFPFLYAMDGVSDLEFHLVQCKDRHLSGYALQRFERMSKFNAGNWFNKRYEPYFGNRYWLLTKEYIDSLIDIQVPGSCFYAEYDKGVYYYYLKRIWVKLLKKLHIKLSEKKSSIYYSQPTEEEFLKKTRSYTRKLFASTVIDNTDVLMIDQLIASSNVERCMRYVDDNLFVFIVDRDPRDVYLSNKYIWKEAIVPSDPYEYCKWFKITHNCENVKDIKHKRVKRLFFEDLIYRYDSTVKEIEEFCGIKPCDHIAQFSKLNPRRSVVNTRLWEKFDDENVKVIEKVLCEYLYDYNGVDLKDIKGVETKENNLF